MYSLQINYNKITHPTLCHTSHGSPSCSILSSHTPQLYTTISPSISTSLLYCPLSSTQFSHSASILLYLYLSTFYHLLFHSQHLLFVDLQRSMPNIAIFLLSNSFLFPDTRLTFSFLESILNFLTFSLLSLLLLKPHNCQSFIV